MILSLYEHLNLVPVSYNGRLNLSFLSLIVFINVDIHFRIRIRNLELQIQMRQKVPDPDGSKKLYTFFQIG
jgi:hypothetical protein